MEPADPERVTAIEKRIERLEEQNEQLREENEELREKVEDRKRTPRRQNAASVVGEHYGISEESAHRLATNELAGPAAEAYRERGRPVPSDLASAAAETDDLEEAVPSAGDRD